VGTTSTPKKSGRPPESSFIEAMIAFTSDPEELPNNLSEWSAPQDLDENIKATKKSLSSIKPDADKSKEVAKLMVSDSGVLLRIDGDKQLIVIPSHLRRAVLFPCHDHNRAG
jgi:hypothetical protein